jgi:hypothetical protein
MIQIRTRKSIFCNINKKKKGTELMDCVNSELFMKHWVLFNYQNKIVSM